MSGELRSKRPRSAVWRYLTGRLDGLTSAVLVVPLLLTYQIGILSGRGQNGVDFLTRALVDLVEADMRAYVGVMGATFLAYVCVLVLLRRRGAFSVQAFAPMLLESSVYALLMGSLITVVMREVVGVLPSLSMGLGGRGTLDVLVISAGAGFHEELIFRLVLMGGLAWLMTAVTGRRRAWVLALGVSSLLFSLAHHIGPAGEAFTYAAFVYRALAGVFFALVYQVRGFAVAAWTHALYDVYVLSFA